MLPPMPNRPAIKPSRRTRPALPALLAAACLAWAAPQPAPAQMRTYERTGFTLGEMALLPEICKDIQGTANYEGARGDHWRSVIGDALAHMHHYCRGMRDMLRLRAANLTPAQRRTLWDSVAREMLYVIRQGPADMAFMPELWLHFGVAQLNLGNPLEAQRSFEEARRLRPDYWPAYTAWADFLLENRQAEQARAVVEEGLRHAPDAPELLKRRDRLAAGR